MIIASCTNKPPTSMNLTVSDLVNQGPVNLNGLALLAHSISKSKGFYEKPAEMGTRVALIHSEVSELLEADRKASYTNNRRDAQHILGHLGKVSNELFAEMYNKHIKGTAEEEMADIIIRVLDMAGWLKIDINGHVLAKMAFNETREYKHGKSY